MSETLTREELNRRVHEIKSFIEEKVADIDCNKCSFYKCGRCRSVVLCVKERTIGMYIAYKDKE